MANRDSRLFQTHISAETKALFIDFNQNHPNCEFPLENEASPEIVSLYTVIKDANEYAIFRHPLETDELWRMLPSKAIKCLRYFDEREPLKNNIQKKPQIYGFDGLANRTRANINWKVFVFSGNEITNNNNASSWKIGQIEIELVSTI